MGERKVLNKYVPPDFDPAAVPRRKMPKNQQIVVRMMLPMSICCKTCGNYIYKGTKFNCRKEDVPEEAYLGILVFRFYFKCTRCSAELAMKTDPKNSDYIMEAGATRNFEPWRDKDEAVDIATAKQEAEEMGDAMKALENRTMEAKREMDILSALDEMKSLNSRHACVSHDQALMAVTRKEEQDEEAVAAAKLVLETLDEEDEAAVRAVFQAQSNALLRRLDDGEPAAKRACKDASTAPTTSLLDSDIVQSQDAGKQKALPGSDVSFGVKALAVKFAVKKKNGPTSSAEPLSAASSSKPVSAGLSSLLGAYGSSDDSGSEGSP